MAKEKYLKPKKSFGKKLLIAFVSIITSLVVLCGGVIAFAYFKYDINTFSLIGSINKVGNFSSTDVVLSNAFSASDLESANSKKDSHDFTENYIYFTDKEIAAVIDDNIKNDTSLNLGYDVSFLELTFSDYEDYEDNLITRLNFTVKFNAKDLKDGMTAFPANLVSSKIPESIYMFTSVNLIEGSTGDTSYSVKYNSMRINGLTVKETENLFRVVELVSKNFKLSTIAEKIGTAIADGIIGNDQKDGVYTELKDYGAKGYLFTKEGNNNTFSVFAHTVDEERTISYSNTMDIPHSNPTVYTLKNGVITLEPLSRLGYDFLGWFDEGNNKIETIRTVKMLNYNLTAKWQLTTYTITYNLKGGTVASPGNPDSYTIETETFSLKAPEKAGDTFLAWSGTGIDGESATVTITKGTTGNLTFTAHYEFDEVFMTVCVDGIELISYELENGTTLTKELVNSVYALEEAGMVGYTVDNWYSNAAMTTPYTFGNKVIRDFTIYGSGNYFVSSPLTKSNVARYKQALASSDKKLTITSHDDLVSWAFYVMFTGITEKVYLTLPSSVPQNVDAIVAEISSAVQDAYDISTFQSASTLSSWSNGTYGAVFVTSSTSHTFASQTLNSTGHLYTQLDSTPTPAFEDTRSDTYNNFNINNVQTTLEVQTSEQLVYALEMGFNPVCKSGSKAEIIYNKAKVILRDICNDSMTNIEKSYAIYTWLVMNVQYDYLAYEKSGNGEISAAQSRLYDSWFAEGVFNQKKAVCEGFAKAFLIMARLENIPCVFVTGNNHAWNKVYVNGAWFGVDATHGNAGNGSNQEILSFSEFLFTDTYKTSKGYSTADHSSIKATTVIEAYDYINFTYSETTFDLYINSTAELNVLLNYIKANISSATTNYVTFEVVLANSLSYNTVYSAAENKGIDLWEYYVPSTTSTGKTAFLFYVVA